MNLNIFFIPKLVIIWNLNKYWLFPKLYKSVENDCWLCLQYHRLHHLLVRVSAASPIDVGMIIFRPATLLPNILLSKTPKAENIVISSQL